MKKKLFAVATIMTIYSLFTLALSSLENQENPSSILTDIEFTAVSTKTSGHTSSELELKSGFRNPIPTPGGKPGRPAK